jgi:hypothetical protein
MSLLGARMRLLRRWPSSHVNRLLLLAAAAALLFAACGGDDDASTTPSATATATGGGSTPNATPSAGTTPTVSKAAGSAAQAARYFLYEAAKGDTLASIADAFDAVHGTTGDDELIAEIRRVNELTRDALTPGQTLAIPLYLSSNLSFIPEASIQEALGAGPPRAGALVLLQPSLAIRDGLKGRLALHRVRLADGNPAEEGAGYLMEYWLTDRPAVKGGTVDVDARVTGPAFIVAAGAFAASLQSAKPGDLVTFTRDGVTYALRSFLDTPSAQQLADGLLAAPR